MRFTTTLPILFPLLLSLLFTSTHAATFDILNKCTYTVWAAASPGGGRRLDSGQSWTITYCCTDGPGSCGPTTYSKFFKDRCPDAYSYPQDDKTSLFTCPSGTNYKVTFCP
ncbi:unnamed protein product, partial [Vitis vinifera]